MFRHWAVMSLLESLSASALQRWFRREGCGRDTQKGLSSFLFRSFFPHCWTQQKNWAIETPQSRFLQVLTEHYRLSLV